MKLDNITLVKEFYEKHKNDLCKDMTFEEVRLCCTAQYGYARKEIQSGSLATIRLKYFGTFLVYPKKAKTVLDRMYIRFKEHRINNQLYFNKKQMIDKFLENENQLE